MVPTMVQKSITQLSYSSVSEFLSCPRSWYSRRILGKEQPRTEAAGFGSLFDQVVANRLGLGADPLEGADMTDPVHQSVVDAADLYMSHPLGWKTATEAQKEIRIEPTQWGSLADEFGAYGDLHVPFVGFLDLFRADGLKRSVCDLKTADRKGFKSGWLLQTALYALATRSQKIEVHVLVRTKEPKLCVYEYRPTDTTFRWALSTVGYVAELIRQAEAGGPIERFAAIPGYYCMWCSETDCEAKIANSLTEVGE